MLEGLINYTILLRNMSKSLVVMTCVNIFGKQKGEVDDMNMKKHKNACAVISMLFMVNFIIV